MVLNVESVFATKLFSDTPEDGSVNVWDGSRWVSESPTDASAILGTLGHWQACTTADDFSYTATGYELNDGVTYTSGADESKPCATAIDKYYELTFPVTVRLKRWRQFGSDNNVGDGTWKIQYFNLKTYLWTDWVTNIPTRTSSDYSDYATETAITTNKIKLICTAVDTQATYGSTIQELEVIY